MANYVTIAQVCGPPSGILSTFCRWLPYFPAMSKSEATTDRQTISLFQLFCSFSHIPCRQFFLCVQPVGHQHPVPYRQTPLPQHTLRRSTPLDDLGQVGCAAGQSPFTSTKTSGKERKGAGGEETENNEKRKKKRIKETG